MELVVVVSPKRREGQGPEAWGRRHRKRTRRRIPRPPRWSYWGAARAARPRAARDLVDIGVVG